MPKEVQDLFDMICPILDIREVSGIDENGVDFRYGMLVLSGNRYRMISRIRGVNFYLLSEEEKQAAMNALRSSVLSLDFYVQFFTVSEMVDLKKAAADLAEAAADLTGGPAEYALAMMDLYAYLSAERSIKVRRSYAVIGVDSPQKPPEQELCRRVSLFKAAMHSGGVRTEVLTPEQVINLLHDVFNPGRIFRPAEALGSVGAIADWKEVSASVQEKEKY